MDRSAPIKCTQLIKKYLTNSEHDVGLAADESTPGQLSGNPRANHLYHTAQVFSQLYIPSFSVEAAGPPGV